MATFAHYRRFQRDYFQSKVKKYLFAIYCYDGGWGWGETGQEGRFIIKASSIIKATKELKYYIPGGWSYEYKGITDKKEGLITDLEQLKKVEKEENNHE